MQERDQMLAIIHCLVHDGPSLHGAADLREPWRTIYQRVRPAVDRADAEIVLRNATHGMEECGSIVRGLAELLPGDEAFQPYPSLGNLAAELEAPRWLWPSWLPRGMITLLGAAPGAGKSFLALDLAGRLISGQAFPDGASGPAAGSNIIYVDAESTPGVLNQRAEAWGFDRRRLFPMIPPGAGHAIHLGNQRHQERLTVMCLQLQPPLVVVDSLSAAYPGAEDHLGELQAMLEFFNALARGQDLALLLIHHLRKLPKTASSARPRQVTADDLRGYSHLAAVARSILALSPLEADSAWSSDNRPRLLKVIKTNLCRCPPPLQVGFASAPVLTYSPLPPPTASEPTRAEACAAWLVDLLKVTGRPIKPIEVVALAREVGFRRGVVYRARRDLEGIVVDTEPKFSPANRWRLARKGVESAPTSVPPP